MNTKNTSTVDVLLIAAMLTADALVAIVRLVVVPLIALAVVLLTPRRRPAPQPAPIAPAVPAVPAEPVLAPVSLGSLAAELLELPAVELRRLAGTRRRLPKAQLIQQICAMPL